jgi:hypothetical protein
MWGRSLVAHSSDQSDRFTLRATSAPGNRSRLHPPNDGEFLPSKGKVGRYFWRTSRIPRRRDLDPCNKEPDKCHNTDCHVIPEKTRLIIM